MKTTSGGIPGEHVSSFFRHARRQEHSMHRLHSAIFAMLFVMGLATAFAQQPAQQTQPFDVVILNGRIIDGSGNPWYRGDVGIRGDRIAAIGKLADAPAKQRIDATDLVVSPGFIDMLGQSETALLIDNRAISKLSQGITTEITGEGGSIAPQNALTLKAT